MNDVLGYVVPPAHVITGTINTIELQYPRGGVINTALIKEFGIMSVVLHRCDGPAGVFPHYLSQQYKTNSTRIPGTNFHKLFLHSKIRKGQVFFSGFKVAIGAT